MQNNSKLNTVLLIVLIVIGLTALILLWGKTKQSVYEEDNNVIENESSVVNTGNQAQTQDNVNNLKSTFADSRLGLTFEYPKEFVKPIITIAPADKGKMFGGYLTGQNSSFRMTIGGTTPIIEFPGELNANEVSKYPTDQQLQNLTSRGYKNEKKTNSKGEEYVLIHGQHEVDMPYIGENQAVAIFKLKSSVDFAAIGFMLVSGDMATFLSIIDSVSVN